MKKIIFISHDASRTGAPMLLLNLVEWLSNKKSGIKIYVLLVKGGDLEPDFKKYATTYRLDKYTNSRNLIKKVFNKFFREYIIFGNRWDIIFSNTIVNGKVLDKFKNKKTPIISYVHELKDSINLYAKRGQVKGTLEQSNYFFCGSNMVKETLEEYFNVSQLKTAVIHSFIEYNNNLFEKDVEINNQLREELKIVGDTMIVGMLGTFDKRKGCDLFIETARKMTSKNIHFVWVGASIERVNELVEKSTFKDLNISLVPPSSDYLKYYHLIEVLFLSSREDPYPMVMVEASAYGLPIICFKDAGGTQEFIDEKVGYVVPFEDIDEVVESIESIYNNRSLLTLNKDYIQKKSMIFHDINLNAACIYEKIEELY